MTEIALQTLIPVAGAITAFGGAILTIQKILANAKKERESESAKILQDAKEEISSVKHKLEARIESVKSELKALEASTAKDFNHIRETYNGEIRNLGEKIEELRGELRDQHAQLVQLLSKMIENRD